VLRVYTCHYRPCAQTDSSSYRRCHCPKWINGMLALVSSFALPPRHEAGKLRSVRPASWKSMPIRWPISSGRQCQNHDRGGGARFPADEEARQLAKTTICQSKTLFERQFLAWTKSQSLFFSNQLTTARLRDFRASWKTRP
jgi:hypothetical protein